MSATSDFPVSANEPVLFDMRPAARAYIGRMAFTNDTAPRLVLAGRLDPMRAKFP